MKVSKKTRQRRKSEREMDKSARKLVLDRDEWTCQRCGKRHGDWDGDGYVEIQWSHIISRRFKIGGLRWHPSNSLAHCKKCHKWFTHNHTQGNYWFSQKFPDRWHQINYLFEYGDKPTAAYVRELAAQLEERA